MGLIRFLARLCLSGMFVFGGYHAFITPGPRSKALPNIGMPESELAVQINGATMVVAGATMALGIAPRLSALALLGALLPTTAAGHAFWKETEQMPRLQQQTQFLKNLSLVGGLLLVLSAETKEKE